MKKINIDKPRGLEYNNKYKKLVGPKGFRLRENPSWEPATREFDSPRLHHCFLKKEEKSWEHQLMLCFAGMGIWSKL